MFEGTAVVTCTLPLSGMFTSHSAPFTSWMRCQRSRPSRRASHSSKPPAEREGSEEIETQLRAALEDVPGVAVLFTTPLGMRIDGGLGGTVAQGHCARVWAGPQSSGGQSTGNREYRTVS